MQKALFTGEFKYLTVQVYMEYMPLLRTLEANSPCHGRKLSIWSTSVNLGTIIKVTLPILPPFSRTQPEPLTAQLHSYLSPLAFASHRRVATVFGQPNAKRKHTSACSIRKDPGLIRGI